MSLTPASKALGCSEGRFRRETALVVSTVMVGLMEVCLKVPHEPPIIQAEAPSSHLISSAVNSHGLQLCPVPVPGPLAGHWEKPGQRSLTNEAPSSHRGLFPATAAPAQVFPEAYSSNFPSHGVHTQKSPLKTPVPRRYAPEPVPKNGKISEKENSVVEKENISKPTREGEGKGLEHVLNSQETPLKQVEYSKKAALNSNERSWHSERHRHKALPPDAISSFESYSSIEKTVQKADHLLQDLGKLRREMHNILQEATTWKSDMNDLIKRCPGRDSYPKDCA
ncbi:TALPID3 protein-like [Taeniopygia guttata]|uniref:TALPID3 protein-like n=1 Tax=Taeniopygia guttata TaxID=59729 RepID=UPI003BB90AF8